VLALELLRALLFGPHRARSDPRARTSDARGKHR
jgi:hypothetical protein